MRTSELGPFKPLLKGYDVKVSELEKIDATKIGLYEVWAVQFPNTKRLWVKNGQDVVFDVSPSEFTSLIKVISWGKTALKN